MKGAITACAFAMTIAGLSPSAAADPKGIWLTAGQDAQIRVSSCGGEALCGTVVALTRPLDPNTGKPMLDKNNPDAGKRSRPVVGIQILLGMRPSGENRWSGQIYNSSDGNVYEGNITAVSGSTLRIEGCLFGFCQAQNWSRVN